MNIATEITKEVFEQNVPAAKTAQHNVSVFNRLKEFFEPAWQKLLSQVVSPSFETAVDDNPTLKNLCIRAVCLDVFVRNIRSLDLVLTATGFGIVSTESTAPASRARVDALLDEMQVDYFYVIDRILILLTSVKGWGDTSQAQSCIRTLFFHPLLLNQYSIVKLSEQSWQLANGVVATADGMLRGTISDEYMDELLQKQRTNTLNDADRIIVGKCLAFFGDCISRVHYSGGMTNSFVPNEHMLRVCEDQLENYSDSYPTYCTSRLYAKRHAKRYQNKREDPSFFFM